MHQKSSQYRIERITRLEQCDQVFAEFFIRSADHVAFMFGCKFNWRNFDFLRYAAGGAVWVCFKDEKPVGAMLARLYGSVFDPSVKILMQDLCYVSEPGGRAAHLLMTQFIDFGKSNANHILTMVAPQTNIKGRSLEKLGFQKIEELYRLEV